MTEMLVGIRHDRNEINILPTLGAEMSVIGIIGTATGANGTLFPLNTNVQLYTYEAEKVSGLGTGYLADAVAAITAQLGRDQGAAKIIIRRVNADATKATQVANILGVESSNTGIYGFLNSGEENGWTPRIIVAEDTEWGASNGVRSIAVSNGGTGYTSAPSVTFTGGGGTGAAGTAVIQGGAVVSITITNQGSGYTTAPTIGFTGGAGSGAVATATLGILANPIVAALPSVLQRLRAVSTCQGPSASQAAFVDWRENIQSDRIIPVALSALVFENGSTVTRPMAPRIAGLLVRRDHEFDGRPFRSAANQPVYGIVGVNRTVRFSLVDPNTEGHTLIENRAGIVVRGESGLETALSDGGFVYWGTDTCSADPLWQFYHVVRGRDYIELSQVRALRFYLGRYNITVQTVEAVLNTMKQQLSSLKADGDILDFRVGFQPDQNSPEDLRLGFLTVDFRAEEPPVLRKITVRSRRYRDALDTLARQVAVSLQTVAA